MNEGSLVLQHAHVSTWEHGPRFTQRALFVCCNRACVRAAVHRLARGLDFNTIQHFGIQHDSTFAFGGWQPCFSSCLQ